jgi:hypothetical protein
VEDLRANYPVFDFDHGHGLAVVAVGKTLEPGLQWLFETRRKESTRRDFAEYFARLGRACADTHAVRMRSGAGPSTTTQQATPVAALPKSVTLHSPS